MPAPSHGKTAATLPDMPDIPMAQDPDSDDNDDGTFTNVDSTLSNMGKVTNSSGLLLKNPTLQKTIAI